MPAAGSNLLVIGGGPAGLAAAIALARTGFAVDLAEPLPGPIDKCCGEGLLPAAVEALGALGVPVGRLLTEGHPLRGIRFVHGTQSAYARFSTGPGVGLRRTQLHALLRQQAVACGVRITAAPVRMERGTTRLHVGTEPRVPLPAFVVAADGQQSATRTAAGMTPQRAASRRFALRQHFAPPGAPSPDHVTVHWARGAQAYVTPVGDGRLGVAILSRARLPGMEQALRLFPALQQQLAGASACSAPRGYMTLHRPPELVVRDGVALAGDAAGSVDAITGDGLALAFAGALALARALQQGCPQQYSAEMQRLYRVPRVMSRLLLAMGSSPVVTGAAMAALGRMPGLFPLLLRVHSGAAAPDSPMKAVPRML